MWLKYIVKNWLFLLCIYVSPIDLLGQHYMAELAPGEDLFQAVGQKYGTGDVLVSGKFFENIYVNDLGHPYFNQDEYKKGHIVIHNLKFEDLKLKYNVWDQTLLVQRNKNSNYKTSYMPPVDFISEFVIDGHQFKKCNLNGKGNCFYEEIYNGDMSCLCYWEKDRSESAHKVSFMAHKFSEQKKKFYLITNGTHYIFKGKKTLIKLFPEHKKQISKYINEHDIKQYKLTGTDMANLLAFCEKISKNG
ncbi:hypothetical protein [Saccharicrinis sp. 156]|uniref:hypothetical protein n=1 Tax=Saccharicrinis sp. 156 TaxID=3417574 RepID=UPI003D34CFAD